MNSFFLEPVFWVAVAFVVFVIALFKPIKNALLKTLDGRSDKIRAELDHAQRLRKEAQELLASYKQKQLDAEKEAAEIVAHAEKEAIELTKKTHDDLDKAISKKIELALQKISNYEHKVLTDIRNHAIDITMSTVRKIITENLSTEMAQELIENNLKSINSRVN